MADKRYERQIDSNLEAAAEILKNLIRGIEANNLDKLAALHNLRECLKKIQEADYLMDRG